MAKIYRPAKNSMQSGTHRSELWYIEFEPSPSRYGDFLMGWVGSKDTSQQVRLCFPSGDSATAYAKAHNISYIVLPDQVPKKRPKSYAENFLKIRGL